MNDARRSSHKVCIAISGTHGAGTSTAAENVAKTLNLRYISAGKIFRQSAEERGIDIAEFTKIVEGDSFLKEELDSIITEEAKKGNVVVEGRAACWAAGENADLRVMIDAPLHVRIERISQRLGMTLEKAQTKTQQRDTEAQSWFLKEKGIDIYDRSIYDVTINTERLEPDDVTKIICSIFL